MNQYYQGQPQQMPQAQPYAQKTAINDLDSFLSGLTEEEREYIFASPSFGPVYHDFVTKFVFFLLQGDIGTAYINSSPRRREIAEVLKLNASAIHAERQKDAKSEIDKLREQNELLIKRMAELEKKAGK